MVIFKRLLPGLHWTCSDVPISGGLPDGPGTVLQYLQLQKKKAISSSEHPKALPYLVLAHLWRIASIQRGEVLEWNGKWLLKLEMQMEVSVSTACQNSSWILRYLSLKLMYR